MKVEGAILEDVLNYYLFDIGVRKLLLEKGTKYLHDLFKKQDQSIFSLMEILNLDNEGLEGIIGDEGM